MNDFTPRSKQQNEREITVVQKDFSGGVFNDIAASTIPDNGIAYLENFVNKGTELVGRTGSKKWGDYSTGTPHAALPARATGITYSSIMNSEGTEHIVTITGGYSPSSDDVGRFFVFSYGENEEILRYEGGNLITKNESNYQSQSGTGSIRGKVNAIYYHKYLNKIIMMLDVDIYVSSDVYMTSWIKAKCQSYQGLSNNITKIDEKDNYLLIANTNGIYKLELDINPNTTYYYYKINSDVPSSPTTQLAKTDSDVYSRRYLYSLSRMDTESIDGTRYDTTTMVKLESGTNKSSTGSLDYSEGWSVNPISPDNPMLVSDLYLPTLNGGIEVERHWDNYTIWGTTDCGVNGTDPVIGTATNTEQYIWIKDIPIMKALCVDISGVSGTVTDGSLSVSDVGSTLRIYNGLSLEESTIMSVDEDAGTFIIGSSVFGTSIPATIGASKFGSMTYDSGTKTFTVSGGFTLDSTDIGKRIFLSNGYKVFVDTVPTSTSFTTTDTPVVVGSVVGCWGPEQGRNFSDVITDDELRGRIAGFPCYQRFYDKLPNADMICYSAGFLFTATRNGNYIYYSQVPEGFDYMIGYYHPAYQLAHIKDGIREIKPLLDKVVVYGYNTTSIIPTNTYSSVTYDELGIFVAVVPNITTIDEIIGCISYNSIQSLENGTHILITNEPALRIFNGVKYSENLASKKMMNVLKTLQQNITSLYSPITGYIFWGSDV